MKTTIISYPSADLTRTFMLFDKPFPVLDETETFRIVVHGHYPMIDQADIRCFMEYATKQPHIVVSACEAEVHPYRILTVDEHGNEQYLVDISQDIRGNRHRYPDVYTVKPALTSIPPGFRMDGSLDHDDLMLYVFEKEKLMDTSNTLQALMVNRL